MASFSFGNFFRKNPRQPRFNPDPGEAGSAPATSSEDLPVGRLVSFTEHGPQDAPLFQELDRPVASPFVMVGGARPPAVPGGLPSQSRSAVDEGFTADELIALVPSHCVRAGAVPATQVIPLPHGVLRASLEAGQPAVLLSQLHHACPALFIAPSSLDHDLVIALPPNKVQRLVARTDAGGPVAPFPTAASMRPGAETPEAARWADELPEWDAENGAMPSLAVPPSKVRLPPPRRHQFDDPHGSEERSMVEEPAFAAATGPFADLASSPPARGNGASPGAAAPPSNPFQVAATLPGSHQGAGGGMPRLFQSPFAVVSAGEVPSVLESPFARQPVVGFDSPPAPPVQPHSDPAPEPPATVSLRLTALLQGQSAATLGFGPERVPDSVRVQLASAPLLAQIASGRVRVRLEEVLAGLDAKFQPAFQQARRDLELHVPMRELFDNLPEAAPPTPVAAPVESSFLTPFSVRADEDGALAAASRPLAPAEPTPAKAAPMSPPRPPFMTGSDAAPTALSERFTDVASLAASLDQPFILVPETPSAQAVPVPEPVLPTAMDSPFLLVPPSAEARATATESTPPASALPEPPPAPSPSSLPPLVNPFALAPGQGARPGLGMDLSLMSFDEDPVPLESLREHAPVSHQPNISPAPWPAAASEPAATAVPVPEPVMPASLEAITAAPEEPAPPPSLFRFAPTAPPEPAPAPAVSAPVLATAPAVPNPSATTTAAGTEPETSALPAPPFMGFNSPAPAAASLAASPPPLPPAAPAASSPFFGSATFELPPLPAALFSSPVPTPVEIPAPAPAETPSTLSAVADSEYSTDPAEAGVVLPPAFAEAAPFNIAAPSPTADDRAAFAFAFAPSALAHASTGSGTPLADVDTVPGIALAKLPPLTPEPAAPPPSFSTASFAPPAPTETPAAPFSFTPFTPFTPVPPAAPVTAPVEPPADAAREEALPSLAAALPAAAVVEPVGPSSTPAPADGAIEDLSFGYVDNPTQLALRAVFATDQVLSTQDVVNHAARLEGLRSCLVHTPHASLHSASSGEESDDVRHFRDRAGVLFEKTASLVRELDPAAREQSFTLRTARGVVSFFAVGDVCLAVLHAEPSFRPGVREKLTLTARSLADMLAA